MLRKFGLVFQSFELLSVLVLEKGQLHYTCTGTRAKTDMPEPAGKMTICRMSLPENW